MGYEFIIKCHMMGHLYYILYCLIVANTDKFSLGSCAELIKGLLILGNAKDLITHRATMFENYNRSCTQNCMLKFCNLFMFETGLEYRMSSYHNYF
jgi:hypothetical protein